MKLSFHGAARTVTGSKLLITLKSGKKVLLDCGLFQGLGRETDILNRNFGFEPSQVDAMILSHAHIDHCGLVPRLVQMGFGGKIYCTAPTYDLSGVLLEDSAEIQEDEAKYQNKRRAAEGLPYLQPLYTVNDAKAAAGSFIPRDYGQWFPVIEGVEAMFTDAGHIIGSAAVHVRVTENGKSTTITFSGDVGRYRDAILKSPDIFPQADYIILESTYGNSLHDNATTTPDMLLRWIEKACFQKKGKLIMPAFSVGRTQELLYALNQLEVENRLPNLSYFVDSPLSIKATMIVKKYPQYFNRVIRKVIESDSDRFSFNGLRYVQTIEQSKQIN